MAANEIIVGMPTMELMMPYRIPLPKELGAESFSPPFPVSSGGSAHTALHQTFPGHQLAWETCWLQCCMLMIL